MNTISRTGEFYSHTDGRLITSARDTTLPTLVLSLCDEIERLRSQLPEGMKHCTIIAKECEKGHGWLTATNWVQHECPHCEQNRLRAALQAVADHSPMKGCNHPGTECYLWTVQTARAALEGR